MTETEKKYKNKHNPIFFSNERSEALDEAYNLFMEAFTDYATKNELTADQIVSFKEQVLSAYLEKRATYLLEDKLTDFSTYLKKAVLFALTKTYKEDRDSYTKLFYYNNKHHLVSHE